VCELDDLGALSRRDCRRAEACAVVVLRLETLPVLVSPEQGPLAPREAVYNASLSICCSRGAATLIPVDYSAKVAQSYF
jgi:hypothetical protein